MHRQNLDRLPDIIEMAATLGAERLEVAHVQYYGWGLRNRAAFMPTLDQVKRSAEIVAQAQERLKGVLVIDFVVPDYYARRPKPITPAGKVLPCHAAESIQGLAFENVAEEPLKNIWLHSSAFRAFRGTDWMPDPCSSCEGSRLGRLSLPAPCTHR